MGSKNGWLKVGVGWWVRGGGPKFNGKSHEKSLSPSLRCTLVSALLRLKSLAVYYVNQPLFGYAE